MDPFLHKSERQGIQKFVCLFFQVWISCLVKLENNTSNLCWWYKVYVASLQHELKLSLSFNNNTRRNDIIGTLQEFGTQSVAVNTLVGPKHLSYWLVFCCGVSSSWSVECPYVLVLFVILIDYATICVCFCVQHGWRTDFSVKKIHYLYRYHQLWRL